jgi:hypothetical protein
MKTALFAAATAAAALMASATAANAATSFDIIDSTLLNLNGTEGFSATITDDLGAFVHSFSFTLDAANEASATIGTIKLGAKDIDFTSIDLDGTAFTQVGFDPSGENWQLLATALASGSHTLTLRGSVVAFGTTPGATYTGSLNLDTGGGGGNEIPEPGVWAMMIMGFGGVGAMMRRRRTPIAA